MENYQEIVIEKESAPVLHERFATPKQTGPKVEAPTQDEPGDVSPSATALDRRGCDYNADGTIPEPA